MSIHLDINNYKYGFIFEIKIVNTIYFSLSTF